MLTDLIMNEIFHAFHHDDKRKSAVIHELQILLTEVTSIQNEADSVSKERQVRDRPVIRARQGMPKGVLWRNFFAFEYLETQHYIKK
ncbi:hypothetical protein ACTND3_01835 [Bacillota bacterium HCP28S3_F12]|nr:hypothetical protein [Bacillota bacterium]